MHFGENPQHDFPKMRREVNGRLELFRKFIRFGRAKLPLGKLQVQSVVLSRIAGIELMTGQRASFEHLPAGGETHSSRWELNVTCLMFPKKALFFIL